MSAATRFHEAVVGLRTRFAASGHRAVAFTIGTVAVGVLACGGSASDSVAPPPAGTAASIAITPSAPPAVAVGSQFALQAEVHDVAGQIVPGATVFWSSLDSTVATVTTTGVVTGKALGSTQIAASAGGQSAVVPVAVVPVALASIAILPAQANVTVGTTVALQAIAYDATGQVLTGRSVVWATSAPQIATVDGSGTVTGVSAGTATITGASEGKTASASVIVTLSPVASVAVTPGSATLVAGRTVSLTAVATDANGNVLSGRALVWSSANPSIATVSALGLVTAVAAGSTTINATSEGKAGTAQIVVTPPPVASVTLAPSSLNLEVGTASPLSATLRDSSGTSLSGRTITWTTSTPTVATVSTSGTVTAVAAGTAVIAATSEGKSGTATVTVTVPPPTIAAASVRVTPATVSLRNNQTRSLTAEVLDSRGNTLSGRAITWSSSDSSSV
ncbi:MAG: Ig-like domain-containing protein, partial [Gemmatimonadaceae bacterium]